MRRTKLHHLEAKLRILEDRKRDYDQKAAHWLMLANELEEGRLIPLRKRIQDFNKPIRADYGCAKCSSPITRAQHFHDGLCSVCSPSNGEAPEESPHDDGVNCRRCGASITDQQHDEQSGLCDDCCIAVR